MSFGHNSGCFCEANRCHAVYNYCFVAFEAGSDGNPDSIRSTCANGELYVAVVVDFAIYI